MSYHQDIVRTALNVKCTHCNKDLVVGAIMPEIHVEYVLTPEQIEAKRKTVLELLEQSTLGEDQKKATIEYYSDPQVPLHPSLADLMIDELKAKHMPVAPKSDDPQEPKA